MEHHGLTDGSRGHDVGPVLLTARFGHIVRASRGGVALTGRSRRGGDMLKYTCCARRRGVGSPCCWWLAGDPAVAQQDSRVTVAIDDDDIGRVVTSRRTEARRLGDRRDDRPGTRFPSVSRTIKGDVIHDLPQERTRWCAVGRRFAKVKSARGRVGNDAVGGECGSPRRKLSAIWFAISGLRQELSRAQARRQRHAGRSRARSSGSTRTGEGCGTRSPARRQSGAEMPAAGCLEGSVSRRMDAALVGQAAAP